MKLFYLIPRTIRHFMPASAVRGLLRQGLIIRPGLETSDPQAAVERYITSLAGFGRSIAGKRVMVFGYGGRFGVACGLLDSGAQSVVLCDRFAPPDHAYNRSLVAKYPGYLALDRGTVRPQPGRIQLVQADIREDQVIRSLDPQDLVLSSSVYEHLSDVETITDSLHDLTAPGGAQLHIIDLRDHFFKYPFEMLCYDERVWRRWLNPGSNLNRLRFQDYREIFESRFRQVEMTVLTSDQEAFERARPFIRPEFLTGDRQIDSVTSIQVFAEV